MRPEQLEHTLPGHPCLAQYPAYDNSAATTSPVPIVPTTPATPDPANDQDTNSQATLVPIVPTVPYGTHIIRRLTEHYYLLRPVLPESTLRMATRTHAPRK